MPAVEDEWLNAELRHDPTTLPTKVLTTPHQVPTPLNPFSLANPNIEVESFEYHRKSWDYLQLQRFSRSSCILGLRDVYWNCPYHSTKVSKKLPENWNSATIIIETTISGVKATSYLPSCNQSSIFPQTKLFLLANISGGSLTSCRRK